ncbi:MAG TPA: hypothetical protein VJ922_06800 [Actinomycetota bacterium]|nr:hypothetical protein [Actinomycetota bacterium]
MPVQKSRKPRSLGTIVVVVLLALIAPLPARTQTSTPSSNWQEEVRSLLNARAKAVTDGNEQAFVATMRGAKAEFREEKVTWFRRLRALPLGHYSLVFDQGEYSELTRAKDLEKYPGEVHVIQVKERIGFRGYDVTYGAEDVFLTVLKGGQGWGVVADDDVVDIALQSNRNLWDFGPVDFVQDDGIVVMFHPSEREAGARMLAISKTARDAVIRQWPNRWRENKIVLMIPTTVNELARILQTTFDLSTFVAFAASSVDREKGWDLIGPRVYLHWPNFRDYSTAFQRSILQHEFLHLAARELTGPYVTSIMDEGVAQYYGEAAYNPPTPQLRTMVRAGRFDRHLAEDFIFTAGTPNEIYAAYEQANHFIAYVGDRYGRSAGARLYRDFAAQSAVAPGTWRYHLDRACRSALGIPFATLERDWARRVVQELS